MVEFAKNNLDPDKSKSCSRSVLCAWLSGVRGLLTRLAGPIFGFFFGSSLGGSVAAAYTQG